MRGVRGAWKNQLSWFGLTAIQTKGLPERLCCFAASKLDGQKFSQAWQWFQVHFNKRLCMPLMWFSRWYGCPCWVTVGLFAGNSTLSPSAGPPSPQAPPEELSIAKGGNSSTQLGTRTMVPSKVRAHHNCSETPQFEYDLPRKTCTCKPEASTKTEVRDWKLLELRPTLLGQPSKCPESINSESPLRKANLQKMMALQDAPEAQPTNPHPTVSGSQARQWMWTGNPPRT